MGRLACQSQRTASLDLAEALCPRASCTLSPIACTAPNAHQLGVGHKTPLVDSADISPSQGIRPHCSDGMQGISIAAPSVKAHSLSPGHRACLAKDDEVGAAQAHLVEVGAFDRENLDLRAWESRGQCDSGNKRRERCGFVYLHKECTTFTTFKLVAKGRALFLHPRPQPPYRPCPSPCLGERGIGFHPLSQ
jgi:hypothetical protein